MRRADAKPGPSNPQLQRLVGVPHGYLYPVFLGVSSIPNLQGNLHSSSLPIGLVFILEGT